LITREPAIGPMREWAQAGAHPCEILTPSEARGDVLLSLQVTTRSALGALAYETGGILIDSGWLRFIGSGHPRLTRDLVAWNDTRSHGFYLVADDAVGGFFALNGGAFGPDLHNVYYWPPDSLRWEPLRMGFSDLFRWALTSRVERYYEPFRWPTWKDDLAALPGDRCFSFSPALWTREGSVTGSRRADAPVTEVFDRKLDRLRELQDRA
jgi:hypothetical protein